MSLEHKEHPASLTAIFIRKNEIHIVDRIQDEKDPNAVFYFDKLFDSDTPNHEEKELLDEYFHKLSEQDLDSLSPRQIALLGRAYQLGLGVKTNIEKAIQLYNQAIVKNEPIALRYKAGLYKTGVSPDILATNLNSYLSLLKHAADRNDPQAQILVSDQLRKGKEVKEGKETGREKDVKLADAYLIRAAELKQIGAQIKLGMLLARALLEVKSEQTEIKEDPKKAILHFSLAAENGDPEALALLGLLLIKGTPEKQIDIGIEYIWTAAMTGNPRANIMLAKLYEEGVPESKIILPSLEYKEEGLKSNLARAAQSFRNAGKIGNNDLKRLLEKIKNKYQTPYDEEPFKALFHIAIALKDKDMFSRLWFQNPEQFVAMCLSEDWPNVSPLLNRVARAWVSEKMDQRKLFILFVLQDVAKSPQSLTAMLKEKKEKNLLTEGEISQIRLKTQILPLIFNIIAPKTDMVLKSYKNANRKPILDRLRHDDDDAFCYLEFSDLFYSNARIKHELESLTKYFAELEKRYSQQGTESISMHFNTREIFLLGIAFQYGIGVTQDLTKAKILYGIAEKNGEEVAKIYKAKLDGDKAFVELESELKLKEKNHPMLLFHLSSLYLEGNGEFKKNIEKSDQFLIAAANLKYLPALGQLGKKYARSLLKFTTESRIPENLEKAVFYLTQAAERGDPEALANLGMLLINGVPAPDINKALKYINEALKSQHPLAYQVLAMLNKEGIGVQKNWGNAAKLYRGSGGAAEIEAKLLFEDINKKYQSLGVIKSLFAKYHKEDFIALFHIAVILKDKALFAKLAGEDYKQFLDLILLEGPKWQHLVKPYLSSKVLPRIEADLKLPKLVTKSGETKGPRM